MDTGLKRKMAGSARTETEFIRRRRISAMEAGNAATRGTVARGDEWGEAHDKELSFQKRKANAKAIDALAENALLEHEVTPAIRRALADKQAKRVSDFKARQRKETRAHENMKGSSGAQVLNFLSRKNVFVERRTAVSAPVSSSSQGGGSGP